MQWVIDHKKAIVGAIGVAATLVTQMNVQADWVSILVAIATALGVYGVRNGKKPK